MFLQDNKPPALQDSEELTTHPKFDFPFNLQFYISTLLLYLIISWPVNSHRFFIDTDAITFDAF